MYEWSEAHWQVRKMIRKFVEKEIEPKIEEIEHGTEPPYAIMRAFFRTFGLAEVSMQDYGSRLKRRKQQAAGESGTSKTGKTRDINMIAMKALPVIELSRVSPGMVTALGVSVGLTGDAIMSRGTIEQIETFVPDVVTLKKIGAWAITEPGSGSDAFGAMRSTARRDGDHFIINGSKTFITNGPYAETIVFICKLDDGQPIESRPVISFILDGDMDGLVRSKPLRKMGLHSSPTGELFADDLRVHKSRLLGGEKSLERSMRDDAKSTFGQERTGVLAMALGMIERAQELSIDYARTRVQFGKPIGERQLIQLKLAKMEVARQNVQNLLFRTFELAAAGQRPSLAEASAGKLYAAQVTMDVCLEAVQVFGGNGYMSEYRVEQLARDAKVLQIYGGTDEIQICQIARSLLATS